MLAGYFPAAHPAVWRSCAGKEQSKVIVDFCSSGDGRAWVSACLSLLNGNGRWKAGDISDGGFLHLLEKLSRIGTE
jgi:hypothetical protein